MVDASRLLIYGAAFFAGRMAGVSTRSQWALVAVATLSAFGGAILGRRLLPKMTIDMVRMITGCLLLLIGAGMASGLLLGSGAVRIDSELVSPQVDEVAVSGPDIQQAPG